VLLEGILLNLKGEPVGSGSIPIGMRVDFSSLHTDLDDFYGYCTEVLLRGDGLHQDTIRNQLAALGTCVLVVGDAEMMKVHVHTPRPGAVLDLATELGELVRVKVDNMQLQQREFAAAVAEGPSPEPSPAPLTDGTSVVAVALGTGFQQLFESYGAKVVSVDRTMNPSVQDLLQAIDQTDRTEVVVLPNDRNAAPAAEQAARERPDRTVTVVTTESMPAGLGALLALAPDLPAGANASAMAEAAARCHRVELARAVRSARLGDVQVRDGELFALLDGDPVASGNSYPEVLRMALDHVPHAPTEIATVYLGSQATTDLGDELANLIRDLFPIEVEVVFGGQPNFDYIVSLE